MLAMAALSLACSSASAQPQRELRIGVYDNAPKIFFDANGKPTGIMVDLIEKIAESEDWALRFVPCRWADCNDMLARGQLDLLPDVAFTDERASRFTFHSVPVLLSFSQLYRGKQVKAATILDVQGKRIAVLQGSVQAQFLASMTQAFGLSPRFIPVQSFDQAFALVRDGKADLAAVNNFYGDLQAPKYGLRETAILFRPARLFYAGRPGLDQAVMAAIDRQLTAWKTDPESIYFATLQRWQSNGPAQRANTRNLWLLGLSATLLLLAVFAALRFRRQAVKRASELRTTENKLSLILDRVDSLVYIKDEHFRYTYANGALCRILGMPMQDIIGKDDFELHAPRLAAQLRANDLKAMAATQPQTFEESTDVSGQRRDYLSTKMALAFGDGTSRSLCGISSDVTSKKQLEESTRIAATMFQSNEGMLVLGADRVIVDANPAFCTMSGYSAAELAGAAQLPFMLSEHDDGLDASFWDKLALQHKWHGSAYSRRKDGGTYPVLLSVSAVLDESGRPVNYVCTASDITEFKQIQEHNLRLAYYDELTGLPNRRLLFERIRASLLAGATRYGALLFLDLDNFKDLNDTRGHVAGDELLSQVAQRLLACARSSDTVARLGGDEFVIMLDAIGVDAQEAQHHAALLAEQVLATVGAAYDIGGVTHHASCSIGVTLCSHGDVELATLLKRGDLAMYQAKAAGKNAVRFFEPWMEAAIAQRLRIEAELRLALAQDQFVLFYQPQIEDDDIVGAEALLRWRHPERGMIGPVEFIGIAENSDLIVPIGLWVLRAACEQLARWSLSPSSRRLTVAVNVSIRQLMQDDFVDATLAVIAASGANPAQLKLEITESMVIEHVEEATGKMQALRQHGVQFSLDDFGTGYSSLAYLKRLPLEQLKIDRSFVRDILVDPNDALIARSIVALADALGLSIIAEGVETQAQRQKLHELGCRRFQGYLFSKPVPAQEFAALLADKLFQHA